MSEPLVIVGNGMAAARLVDELAKVALGRYAIAVIGDEPRLAYNRVLLSGRIVMMTNGPSARIGEVLEVPLARPRKRLELATNPGYLKCRQRVLEFLYERHRFVEAA